jgi:hypothetical protein
VSVIAGWEGDEIEEHSIGSLIDVVDGRHLDGGLGEIVELELQGLEILDLALAVNDHVNRAMLEVNG